jgi:hypothetical protein
MCDPFEPEKKSTFQFRYSEIIELSKLYDEAEVALKNHGLTQVHYPWYEMAKALQKRGVCQVSEELNKYGRVKWRLIRDKEDPIDPSESLFQDAVFHKKIVSARRFLIDHYCNKSLCK